MSPKVSRCGRYKLYKKCYQIEGGSIILTMDEKVLLYKKMQRPCYVDIASNGTVILGDILGIDIESKVFVYEIFGKLIFEKHLTAAISTCAISDNSEVIFFETLKSKTDHSFKFFLYELSSGKEILKCDSPFCAFGCKPYIDTNKKQVIFKLIDAVKSIDFSGKVIV
jgi:hypothetical protein